MRYNRIHLEVKDRVTGEGRTACGSPLTPDNTTATWHGVTCLKCARSNAFLLKRGY